MKHKHRIKCYTWYEGKLYTEIHTVDSLEEAKHHAHSRGPHSYKIFNAITGEVLFTETLVDTGNQIPDYA